MRLSWCLLLLCAPVASAATPARLLVSIGSDYGRPDDVVLQHAEDDATRVRDLFVELGGVEATRALVLRRPTAAQVRERFAEVTGRVAELKAAGREVQVFVFATSHGKRGVLHLSGTELAVDELRRLATATGAGLRVVIVDACEAGLRTKGTRRGPAYEVTLAPPQTAGDVFLSSSGAHEAAQEWDSLAGSLFTHHLLSALRGDGDVDGDRRVSLMEAWRYAERRTVAESVDVGQHPQFELGLSGSSELVLTELQQSRARVVLGEALEGRYVLVSQPRPDVVVEVLKAPRRPVSLAVPPGRYLLRQTRGFSVAMKEVSLPYGGEALVDERGFVTRDFGEVALKGGELEFHPNALRVTAGLAMPPVGATPARWMVGAGWRLALGTWWTGLALRWGTTRFGADDVTVVDHLLAVRASGGWRAWLGPLLVMPGLVLEGSVLRQHFERAREAEILRSYPPLPVRATPGLALGPQVQVEAPLVGPLFLMGAVTTVVRFLDVEGGPAWTVGVDGELGLGVRL